MVVRIGEIHCLITEIDDSICNMESPAEPYLNLRRYKNYESRI